MKKVLLLGGAGFIGLNIARRLADRGDCDITIADNLFRGKLDDQLSALIDNHGVKLVTADFTDPGAYDQLDGDYDNVYLLASVVGVKYTEEIPHELIRINSMLIMNTLEWLRRSECRKLLFTSTSECYAGTIEAFGYDVPTPETVPLCVEDIGHPRFTYAVTKMLGESACLNYARQLGFDCSIVRYHNVYGPRMGFKHVIPQVTQRFLAGEDPFMIYGFDQTRSFNFIDDAVTGTILAMEHENSNGEIFHIGDMTEITIEELCRFIGGLLDFKGEFVTGESHSGSVSRRCPDIGKARSRLGYEPAVGWQQGVEQTVNWYREYLAAGGDVFE